MMDSWLRFQMISPDPLSGSVFIFLFLLFVVSMVNRDFLGLPSLQRLALSFSVLGLGAAFVWLAGSELTWLVGLSISSLGGFFLFYRDFDFGASERRLGSLSFFLNIALIFIVAIGLGIGLQTGLAYSEVGLSISIISLVLLLKPSIFKANLKELVSEEAEGYFADSLWQMVFSFAVLGGLMKVVPKLPSGEWKQFLFWITFALLSLTFISGVFFVNWKEKFRYWVSTLFLMCACYVLAGASNEAVVLGLGGLGGQVFMLYLNFERDSDSKKFLPNAFRSICILTGGLTLSFLQSVETKSEPLLLVALGCFLTYPWLCFFENWKTFHLVKFPDKKGDQGRVIFRFSLYLFGILSIFSVWSFWILETAFDFSAPIETGLVVTSALIAGAVISRIIPPLNRSVPGLVRFIEKQFHLGIFIKGFFKLLVTGFDGFERLVISRAWLQGVVGLTSKIFIGVSGLLRSLEEKMMGNWALEGAVQSSGPAKLLRRIQHGGFQGYIAWIFATVTVFLLWSVFR